LLNTIVSLSLQHQAAPIEELTLTLEQEHEVKREVTTQVMSWFGTIETGLWNMNAQAILCQVGLSILSTYEVSLFALLQFNLFIIGYQREPVLKEAFLFKWAETVGDAFVADVKLDLIAVRGSLLFDFAR
jgi:sister chromatid cohesion protein DCC1